MFFKMWSWGMINTTHGRHAMASTIFSHSFIFLRSHLVVCSSSTLFRLILVSSYSITMSGIILFSVALSSLFLQNGVEASPYRPTHLRRGVPNTPGYSYGGCYTEATSMRALTGCSYFDDAMTVEKCLTACPGFKYFGLEYGYDVPSCLLSIYLTCNNLVENATLGTPSMKEALKLNCLTVISPVLVMLARVVVQETDWMFTLERLIPYYRPNTQLGVVMSSHLVVGPSQEITQAQTI
jgi:hypothetical protein